MKKKHWEDRDVRCPFYRRTTRQEVICEGFEDGQNITLGWQGGKGRARHMRVFCCRNFENCEIYRALAALWED